MPVVPNELIQQALSILPDVMAATATLAIGWLLASLLRRLTRVLLGRMRRSAEWTSLERDPESARLGSLVVDVVSASVYWLVLLIALGAAAEFLGLSAVTVALGWVARYVPRLVAAILVVVVGLVLGGYVQRAISHGAAAAGIRGSLLLGRVGRHGILVAAGLVALEQLGVDSAMLIVAAGILLGATVGGVSLAFGLGARGEAANIISAHYLARTYRVGQRIRYGTTEGRIIEFKINGLVIDTPTGRLLVPGALLSAQESWLLDEA